MQIFLLKKMAGQKGKAGLQLTIAKNVATWREKAFVLHIQGQTQAVTFLFDSQNLTRHSLGIFFFWGVGDGWGQTNGLQNW